MIQRYVAWHGCSTSGQERVHARQDKLFSPQRRAMTAQLMADETKIAADLCNAERGEAIIRARRIWEETYGRPRVRGQSRIDKGVKRGMLHGKTLRRWEATRRTSVASQGEAMAKRPVAQVGREAKTLAKTAWTPGHDTEHAFQVNKQRQHWLSAITQEHVPPSSVSIEDRNAAEKEHCRFAKLDVQRTEKQAKRDQPEEVRPTAGFSGKRVFFEKPEMQPPGPAASQEYKIGDRLAADIFMVEDPAAPGQRTKWAAALRGRTLVTPARVAGRGGVSVCYAPAINAKRCVWISGEFAQQHPIISQLVRDCSRQRGSQWRLLCRSAFDRAIALDDGRTKRCKRPKETLGLVTIAEKNKEDTAPACVCACVVVGVSGAVHV